MSKTILITGSTDGLGLATAKFLLSQGHRVLLHGRNKQKLENAKNELGAEDGFVADLSNLAEVVSLANAVKAKYKSLDVLINNAGVFRVKEPLTADGMDVRFVVNTLAPYLLAKSLLAALGETSRIVNLSSAAQSPVNVQALTGKETIADDFAAYAQSKLALTLWSQKMGEDYRGTGPMVVAVNPGSMLATKMVKDGFGSDGNDIGKGVDILTRAALSEEFVAAGGLYFDNDAERFASPHGDALMPEKVEAVMHAIETLCEQFIKA